MLLSVAWVWAGHPCRRGSVSPPSAGPARPVAPSVSLSSAAASAPSPPPFLLCPPLRLAAFLQGRGGVDVPRRHSFPICPPPGPAGCSCLFSEQD